MTASGTNPRRTTRDEGARVPGHDSQPRRAGPRRRGYPHCRRDPGRALGRTGCAAACRQSRRRVDLQIAASDEERPPDQTHPDRHRRGARMNPARWLLRSASCAPAAPALLRGTTIVADYATFCARAAAIAGGLRREHDIRPGDRVAIFAGNRTQYLEALYGIWFAGAVAVPINGKLHLREAAWILGDCGAQLVFRRFRNGRRCRGESGARRSDDPVRRRLLRCACRRPSDGCAVRNARRRSCLALLHLRHDRQTEGGEAERREPDLMALCYVIDVDAVHARDAILYAAPMSHGAGLYNFMHVIRGARHVVPGLGRLRRRRDPGSGSRPRERLAVRRANHGAAAGRRCAPTRRRPADGIKTIIYGGGPMYRADIIDAVTVMGPRFVQIYGQGDARWRSPPCPAPCRRPRAPALAGPARLGRPSASPSCAWPSSVQTDRRCPMARSVRSLVHGLPVMQGYWRNDAATAETLAGGWLHTGDMGALDADGYLTLHDRSKDVIISGGTNIYPREVEEALLTHPGVHEVSVIGRPDSEWGESVRRLRGAGRGRDAHRDDARFPLPRADRALQAAESLLLRRGAAQEQLRQGPEDRTQGAPPDNGIAQGRDSG